MAKTIFTIGYQQATQAAVLSALREAGVEVLADVRARPLSRLRALSRSGEGWVGVCHADGREPPPLDPLPVGEGR